MKNYKLPLSFALRPLIFTGGPKSNLLHALFHRFRLGSRVSQRYPVIYVCEKYGDVPVHVRLALGRDSMQVCARDSWRGALRRSMKRRDLGLKRPHQFGFGAWDNFYANGFEEMVQREMGELLGEEVYGFEGTKRIWYLGGERTSTTEESSSEESSSQPLIYIVPNGSAMSVLNIEHQLQQMRKRHSTTYPPLPPYQIWTVPAMFRTAHKLLATREMQESCKRFGFEPNLLPGNSPKHWQLSGSNIHILDTPGWYRGFGSLDVRLLRMWQYLRQTMHVQTDLVYAPITFITVMKHLEQSGESVRNGFIPTKNDSPTVPIPQTSFEFAPNFRYIHTGGTETIPLQLARYQDAFKLPHEFLQSYTNPEPALRFTASTPHEFAQGW